MDLFGPVEPWTGFQFQVGWSLDCFKTVNE